MRNTAYLSHLKESLVEFVKKSTDTTDSKGEEKETVANFYKEFLRENRDFTCRIVRTETVNSPKSSFSRCFAVFFNLRRFTSSKSRLTPFSMKLRSDTANSSAFTGSSRKFKS